MRLHKPLFALLIVAMSLHTHDAKSIAPLVAYGAGVAGGTLLVNPIGKLIDGMYAGNCKLQKFTFRGNQDPNDDEFLYESQEDFEKAMQGYLRSSEENSGEGQGWECDNQACKDGRVVQMPAGHVFEGKVINHVQAYKCDTTVISFSFNQSGDHWVPTETTIEVTEPGKTRTADTSPTYTPDDSKHMNTVDSYLHRLKSE